MHYSNGRFCYLFTILYNVACKLQARLRSIYMNPSYKIYLAGGNNVFKQSSLGEKRSIKRKLNWYLTTPNKHIVGKNLWLITNYVSVTNFLLTLYNL